MGGGLQGTQAGEGLLHLLEEARALIGGKDPAAGAVEQGEFGDLLQLRDEAADLGLGGVEAARRLRHGAGLHHRPEGLDVLQPHAPLCHIRSV